MEVRNKFKGLDLVDRVPKELWTEVHNILQEVVIKTKEKEMQEGRGVVWGGLKNSWEKKRRPEGEGERERYTHLNIEFQKTARRDKKDFLSEQCEELEESNRMGKTRDLFKKIGDTKGIPREYFMQRWTQ